MQNSRVRAGHVIHSLAQSCARGGFCLDSIPKQVKEIIEEKYWLNFISQEFNETVRWGADQFEEFVRAAQPAGLETTVDILKTLCRTNMAVLDLIDQAPTRTVGNPDFSQPESELRPISSVHPQESYTPTGEFSPAPPVVNEINNRPRQPRTPRLTGTSVEQGLSRLRSQHPELHARVVAGEMSVNAACIEAGLRHPMINVRADDPVSAAKAICKKYKGEQLKRLIQELQTRLDEQS